MKFCSTAAAVALAMAAASPLALGAPANPKQTTSHLHDTVSEASGYAGASAEFQFFAQSFTKLDGSRAGTINVTSFTSAYVFVTCTGPEFANVVTVSQSTGAVTINATLDLQNENCYGVNYEGGPLTVKITGRADGNERISESGVGTEQMYGTINKYNFQSDIFSETFDGYTGLYTGQWTGRATSARSTKRTRVQ